MCVSIIIRPHHLQALNASIIENCDGDATVFPGSRGNSATILIRSTLILPPISRPILPRPRNKTGTTESQVHPRSEGWRCAENHSQLAHQLKTASITNSANSRAVEASVSPALRNYIDHATQCVLRCWHQRHSLAPVGCRDRLTPINLLLGKTFTAGHVCPGQICAGHFSAGQICFHQKRTSQICAVQIRTGQICLYQNRTNQLCVLQNCNESALRRSELPESDFLRASARRSRYAPRKFNLYPSSCSISICASLRSRTTVMAS